jgi:hypothetical protein
LDGKLTKQNFTEATNIFAAIFLTFI